MRLIDADALKDFYGKWSDKHTEFLKPEVDHYIDKQPTIDAVPVVHARWEGVDSSYWRWYPEGAREVRRITYRCSRCARRSIIETNYCPNCGAKMDGEKE